MNPARPPEAIAETEGERRRVLDESFDASERAVVERYLRGATEAFRQVTEPDAGN